MEKGGTILIVDDNKAILTAVKLLLRNCFEHILTLSNPNSLLQTLAANSVDVVLLDMNFKAGINNGNEGLFWLNEIKGKHPAVQVVLFTAYADIELAVKGMKEGANNFIVKPYDNQKLIETLLSAYQQKIKLQEPVTRQSKHSIAGTGMYWGKSQAMLQLKSLIEKVSLTDANILVTGENGTGKEMLAREIHYLSKRKKGPMVSVDMGAVTETLFESELFGYVKGAFTDARTDHAGKFEAANSGTLFLDEIGNLPYHMQAKLLTALQNRSIVRVGSNTHIPVDIRLISATNQDLSDMVENGKFREDLLYRINTIHVEIPPLRERKEDIVPLAEIFIKKYCSIYNKRIVSLDDDIKNLLQQQQWQGNIRELEHKIEKAVIICDEPVLSSIYFEFPKTVYNGKNHESEEKVRTLEEMEYDMIKNAIEKNEGNLSLVANQLGISRQTLYNKLKRYGL